MTGNALVTAELPITADGEAAIQDALPQQRGTVHKQVFELAHILKSLSWLADADATCLRQYVRHWHDLGVSAGSIPEMPFEEVWSDFLRAWPKVKFKGTDPLEIAFQTAQQQSCLAAAERYKQSGLRRLAAMCRE